MHVLTSRHNRRILANLLGKVVSSNSETTSCLPVEEFRALGASIDQVKLTQALNETKTEHVLE